MRGHARGYSALLAIFLVAFGLRLLAIETRPVWYDEAFSVMLAERGPEAIAEGTAADTMPPGYYLLLYAWMNLVGQSPLAMRMLSVCLSLLVMAIACAIAIRGLGLAAGRWAAFLLALMPFQIYHAQELRMYVLLALGVALQLYGVLTLLLSSGARRRWRPLACVVLGTATALYAHNLAFVSLLAANVYLGIQVMRRRQPWRKAAQLLAAELIGALAFLPWLVYVPAQLEKVQQAFWTQPPGILDLTQLLLLFTTYLPLPPDWIVLALSLSVWIVVVVLWQCWKLTRQKSVHALDLIVCVAFVPPVLLFALSYLIRPVFVPRALIGSSLAYAMLLAIPAARATPRRQLGLGALVALLAIGLLPFYYSAYGEWRRGPYPEVDAFLQAEWRDGDVILHDNKLSFFPMHFYQRALPQQFLADPPGSDNDTLAPGSQRAMSLFPTSFDTAVRDHPRVWFVIFQTAIAEAEADGQRHANLARLDATMRRGPQQEYGDLRIILYAAP